MSKNQWQPALPGLAQFSLSSTVFTPRYGGGWRVWSGSTTGKFKWPERKKQAVWRWFHQVCDSEYLRKLAGRYGSAFGNAVRVYHALIRFQNWRTGRLDPTYEDIQRAAKLGRSTVAAALRFLRRWGIIHAQPRCVFEVNPDTGRQELRQISNAYVLQPPSQWRLFGDPPEEEPAPPEPGTWGDHPPLPDTVTQAADELARDNYKTAIAALTSDRGDRRARGLVHWAEAIGVITKPPAESERLKHDEDQLVTAVLKRARATMPPARAVDFTVALIEPDPPQWAREEFARLAGAIKARRGR